MASLALLAPTNDYHSRTWLLALLCRGLCRRMKTLAWRRAVTIWRVNTTTHAAHTPANWRWTRRPASSTCGAAGGQRPWRDDQPDVVGRSGAWWSRARHRAGTAGDCRYEDGSAQLLSGSFMDYCLPRAQDLPTLNVEFAPTRCRTNVLGVKGVGESLYRGAASRHECVVDVTPSGCSACGRARNPGTSLAAIQAAQRSS